MFVLRNMSRKKRIRDAESVELEATVLTRGDDCDHRTIKSSNENARSRSEHKAFASRFAQNLR